MALARGNLLLAEWKGPAGEERSESLWEEIGALLEQAACRVHEVDLYSVGIGPGAFTGLRVGVAAAKGMAAAMEKPMVGITSLEIVAYSAKDDALVCALMNGYRGEVYWQVFSTGVDSLPVARTQPQSTCLEFMLDNVEEGAAMAAGGDGAEELVILLSGAIRARELKGAAPRIIRQQLGNRAVLLARLGLARFAAGAAVSAEALKACYVRPAEAEIKLARGLLGPGMGKGIRKSEK